MLDIWVCDACKSINRQRDDHCYRCRAPRSAAMDTPGLDIRAANAAQERAGRNYLVSWPLALIACVLLVAVAILGLIVLRLNVNEYPALRQAFVNRMTSGTSDVGGALIVQSVQIALLGTIRFGLVVLALLAFAGWLALVTRNVPLLGGGTPSRSPERVFVYTLIPIWNLIKVPGMVQDLLYRVDPSEGGAFMVLAAWIGLVGSWLVSLVGTFLITAVAERNAAPAIEAGDLAALAHVFGDVLDQSFWLSVVVEVMIAVGTILLAAIMIRIEVRCAARDAEIRAQMAASGAPTPPVGPAWGAGGPVAETTAATMSATAPPASSGAPPAPGRPSGTPAPLPVANPSAPGEPNWPASRGWPGQMSRTASGEPDDAAGAVGAPAAQPPPAPSAAPPAPPTPGPPPPPPGAPRIG